jgi:hypothetical protein
MCHTGLLGKDPQLSGWKWAELQILPQVQIIVQLRIMGCLTADVFWTVIRVLSESDIAVATL